MPFVRLATAISLLISTALAHADDFDHHVADIMILQSKKVQKDMGVSEAQRARMNAVAKADMQRRQDYAKQLEASKGKPDQARMAALMFQLKNEVLAQLNPGQIRRLRELTLQSLGPVALSDQEVADHVGLTKPQLGRFRSSVNEDTKQIREESQRLAGPIVAKYKNKPVKTKEEAATLRQQFTREIDASVRPRIQAMQKQDSAKLLNILSPAQKAAWQNLQGRPFKP